VSRTGSGIQGTRWARLGLSLVICAALAIAGFGLTGQGELTVVCTAPQPGGICAYPPSPTQMLGYGLLALALLGALATAGWALRRRIGS
jgi:hypothetical protein